MTEKILAVQRMQDYIALHLTEAITLADLAREACYSPWYAARIFRELHGPCPGGLHSQAAPGALGAAAAG